MAESALDKIKKLQAEQQKLTEAATEEALAQASAAVEVLNSLGHSYELKNTARKARGPKKTGSLPPKYAHPENPGTTWSGKGPTPAWLKELEDAGKKRDDFLIDS